jgi:hypothetical protein
MKNHNYISKQLYDYLLEELSPSERREVESHITSCSLCTKELEGIKDIIESSISLTSEKPSDHRSPEFWNNFAFEVERKIKSFEVNKHNNEFSLWDWLYSLFIFHKRQVLAVGTSLTIVSIAITLWLLYVPSVEEKVDQSVISPTQITELDKKINHYLHKSKTLLVSVSNRDTERNIPIDLSAEKKLSRNLVLEARFLQNQPLDYRSARLIGDLEKIQIELATIKDENAFPHIEMVQNGIRKENLLFKLRMAEAAYEIQSGERK